MDDEQLQLQRVLNKFFHTNSKMNEYCLNDFLEYVDKIENSTKDMTKFSIIYTKWIEETIVKLETKFELKMLKFVLELGTIICKSEVKFLILHSFGGLSRLMTLLPNQESDDMEYVKISYVNLLVILVQSKFGIDWLVTSSSSWSNVFKLIETNSSDLIFKQCSILLSEIFLKCIHVNKLFIISLCQNFIAPIHKVSDEINNGISPKENEDRWFKELNGTLNQLCALKLYLSERAKNEDDIKNILKYRKIFYVEESLINILNVINNEKFILKLCELLVNFQFFEMCILNNISKEETHDKAKHYIEKFLDFIKLNIDRGFVNNVIYIAQVALIYWKNLNVISSFRPLNYSDRMFMFENEMLVLQLMPVFCLNLRIINYKLQEEMEKDVLRNEFVDKLLYQTHPMVLHILYQFRNCVEQKSVIGNDINLSLDYMIKNQDFYSRNNGVIIFQSLMYCLNDLVRDINKKQNLTFDFFDCESIILKILKVLTIYIEKFNLNWKDCLETIDVMDTAFDFLRLSFLPSELVVKGLYLVKVTIEKYMSPNLALLVDSNDSGMSYIGPLVYSKLHDDNTEVKNAAMEVLLTLSENAKTKFPYFQKILMEAEFPHLMFKFINSSNDLLIKKNALKCLEKSVLIEEIWSNKLCELNIQTVILNNIKNYCDGSLWPEMISLLTTMYEQDFYEDMFLFEVYKVMSTLSHPNVDVRINILHFWDKVIQKYLQNEGMIDNEFPEMTFSKKLRKIVILRTEEIRKRLIKVMHELSAIGCLNILMDFIKNEAYIEINKRTKKIVRELIELLRKYNISSENVEKETITSIRSNIPLQELFSNLVEIDNGFLDFLDNNTSQDVTDKKMSAKEFLSSVKNVLEVSKVKLDTNEQFKLLIDGILNDSFPMDL